MDIQERILIECSRASRQAPVTRDALARSTNTSDRAVRKVIYDLRSKGYRVCSTTNGRGYWLARSEEDYIEFRGNYTAAASKIWAAVNAMDGNLVGQIKMEGLNG